MSIKKKYEYVVIGAGSGGLTVAVGLQKLNKSVLVVSETIGGDCTHTGCVPSKRLLHLADTYHKMADTSEKQQLKSTVFHAVRQTIQDIVNEDKHVLAETPFVQARAKFIDENHIVINPQGNKPRRIKFKKAIIATGSSARKMNLEGVSPDKILTNETLFHLQSVPESITIIGGGPIGVEMATAFAKLGTKVYLLVRSQIMDKDPRETVAFVAQSLKNLGIEVSENTSFTKLENGRAQLSFQESKIKTIPETDYYLVAAGRVPNVSLGLEAAGVAYDKDKGIPISSSLKTSQKHIYAIGDCTQSPKFTHWANYQGRGVIQNLISPINLPRKGILPWVTFSEPPVASVGQLQESDLISKFTINFSNSDRSKIDGNDKLLGVVYVHMLTGKIVGASVVGSFAEHIINFFTLALNKKITVFGLIDFIAPYPTYFSAITQLPVLFLRDFKSQLLSRLLILARNNFQRIFALAFWLAIIICSLVYFESIDYQTSVLIAQLEPLLISPAGMGIFILLYALRPLIFFSATILTLLAGNIYGFWLGLMLTIVASNISSLVAYTLGKLVFATKAETTSKYSLVESMKKNGFITVLIARLTFVPYDLVSYIAGALKINVFSFLLATALGSIIGTVSIVSLGAGLPSIQDITNPKLEPSLLLVSLAAIGTSIIGSFIIKKLQPKDMSHSK